MNVIHDLSDPCFPFLHYSFFRLLSSCCDHVLYHVLALCQECIHLLHGQSILNVYRCKFDDQQRLGLGFDHISFQSVYQPACYYFNSGIVGILLPPTTKGWSYSFDYCSAECPDRFLPGVEIRKHPGFH